jgi:4-amino-4-deoxy-L-arabinose transferase-like glycosyltransferase
MKYAKSKVFEILVILLLGLVLLTYNLNKPFIGHHDWNGVQYGNMARNYIKYGYIKTKLGQVESTGKVNPEDFSYNTHYTPTYPLLLSVGFRIFGTSEWSARLVSVLFSLWSIYLVYSLGNKLIGSGWGAIASLLMMTTPMWRYFAKMPVHEPVVLAFCLFGVYQYIRWRSGETTKGKFFLAAGMSLLVGWPAVFLAPILFVYDWTKYKKPAIKEFLPIFLATVLVVLLVLLHNFILTGNPVGGGLVKILLFRLNILSSEQSILNSFSSKDFIIQELKWIKVYFTLVQTSLAFVFGLLLVLKKEIWKKYGWVLALIVFGVSYALVFRNAAYIHEYMVFYLAPGVALAATIGLKWVTKKLSPRSKLMVAGIVVITVLVERNEFYHALENTQMHLYGKQVGEEMAGVTQEDDVVAIDALQFALHLSKFAGYYGERTIVYYDRKDGELPEKSTVVVAIKNELPEEFDLQEMEELGTIYYKRINEK